MPRRNDAWDHWYDDLGVCMGKSQRQVKCKYCPHTVAYRADRMLAHLGYGVPRGGVRDVSVCKMVPQQVKQLFVNCGGIVPALPETMLVGLNTAPVEEDEVLEPILSQSGNTIGIVQRDA